MAKKYKIKERYNYQVTPTTVKFAVEEQVEPKKWKVVTWSSNPAIYERRDTAELLLKCLLTQDKARNLRDELEGHFSPPETPAPAPAANQAPAEDAPAAKWVFSCGKCAAAITADDLGLPPEGWEWNVAGHFWECPSCKSF